MNTPMHATDEQIAALFALIEAGELDMPYTVEGIADEFATLSEATLAASTLVAKTRGSVRIYRHGQLVDLRRY